MTDADYYQAHKDDESEWGPPERQRATERERREVAYAHRGEIVPESGRPVKPRKMDMILSVRIDPTVTVLLREAAAKVGITQSEYVRRLICNAARPPRTWSCAHLTIGNTAWARCGHGCEMTAA